MADVEVVHVDGAAPVVPCVAPDAPTDAVPLVPPVPGAPVPLRPAAAGRHELEPEVVALQSDLSSDIFLYIYIYIYMYIYIYTCIDNHIYIYRCIDNYIYIYMYILIDVYIYTSYNVYHISCIKSTYIICRYTSICRIKIIRSFCICRSYL